MILILTIDNNNVGDTDYLEIANLLSSHNYSVITTADINDAIKIAQKISFDVILCCSFTQSIVSIIPKIGEAVRKLRVNLHTQHYPILVGFSAQVSADSIHCLVKQGVDCCYIFKEEINLVDNEHELVSIIRFVMRQKTDNYGFLKQLFSDFN